MAISGCGGSTSTDGSGGSAASGGTGGSTGGTGGATPVGACAGSSTLATCRKCCDAKHPGGNDRLQGVLAACLCKPDVCQAACKASICASPPAAFDGACNACYSAASNDASSCVKSVGTQCNADAVCAAYTACIADSKCLDKP